MSQTKNNKRIKSKALGKTIEEEAEQIIDARVQKNKKPIEIEMPETESTASLDEKNEDDAGGEESEELATDEATLDDEELNPFGDKWEQ